MRRRLRYRPFDIMDERARIIVRGIVQGVGFRPFIHELARRLGLKGFVTNTAEGVLIEIEGGDIDEFLDRLPFEAPALASIMDMSIIRLPVHGYSDFTIRKSSDDLSAFTLVSPDVSVCNDCLEELFDPSDRRYLYPFINCTNCGPRFSIIRAIPYDRPNTTMSSFTMCPECEREYLDLHDRRFHAQPNACTACGPRVEFKIRESRFRIEGSGHPIMEAVRILKQGGIIAVKGIGGFHIACDATNDSAVARLRELKRKSNKPFAVMAPDLDAASMFCIISDDEAALLLDNRRPIVLLRKRQNAARISGLVSPNNLCIGVMLPYTPLHYLLFHHPMNSRLVPSGPHFSALVMTSGNLAEEPIVRDNDEAEKKLSRIVDGFLSHNRDIFMRVDDSVVRMRDAGTGLRDKYRSRVVFIRRSRGYVPDPIPLHGEGPDVLGCGADLKNTFTLTKGAYAIPSQHIGDMENYEALEFFEESLENLKKVYRVDPIAVVHDLHPGYMTTKWAVEKVGAPNKGSVMYDAESEGRNPHSGIERFALQHHYAHVGSVMAEYNLSGPVIGVAFDGTGYGTDGNLWGGEFMIADISKFERTAQFEYIPLPGGEAAIRGPWRTAVSFVVHATGTRAWEHLDRLGFVSKYGRTSIEQIMKITPSREFSPLSSGCGRLFDAVSALLGVCDTNTFEGEAASALESLIRDGVEGEYDVEFKRENGYTVVDFSKTIIGVCEDAAKRIAQGVIATRFHNTIASVIRSVAMDSSKRFGVKDAVLSGGTFQNIYLLERTERLLNGEGLNVYVNRKVPCNDAGVSLGQAYIVRERLKKRRPPDSER